MTAPVGPWVPGGPQWEKEERLRPLGSACSPQEDLPFEKGESGLLFMKQELVQASGDLREPFALGPLNCQKEKVPEPRPRAQDSWCRIQDLGLGQDT